MHPVRISEGATNVLILSFRPPITMAHIKAYRLNFQCPQIVYGMQSRTTYVSLRLRRLIWKQSATVMYVSQMLVRMYTAYLKTL